MLCEPLELNTYGKFLCVLDHKNLIQYNENVMKYHETELEVIGSYTQRVLQN